MSKQEVQDRLDELEGNAVVYSDRVWGVARKASGGDNIWFADCGSWHGVAMHSGEMVSWADDWEVLRGGKNV